MITNEGKNLIFLMSVPRAGSTLLSAILGGHGSVLAPPEPWLLHALKNLMKPARFDPAGGYLISIGVGELLDDDVHLESCRSYALTAYNRLLKENDKSILLDKTPRYYQIIPFIERLFPRAKKIWLVRNPMDIAASYLTTWSINLGDALMLESADRSVKTAFALYDFVLGHKWLESHFLTADSPGRHLIRYEDLVKNAASEIGMLCDFLEIERDERLIDFASNTDLMEKYGKAFMGDKLFTNTEDIHAKSLGKGTQEFNRRQLEAMLEVIPADFFARFGYQDTIEACLEKGVELPDTIAIDKRREDFEHMYRAHQGRLESAFHLIEGLPLGVPAPQNEKIERLKQGLAQKDMEIAEKDLEITRQVMAWEQLEADLQQKDAELNEKRKELAEVLFSSSAKSPMSDGTLDRGNLSWPYVPVGRVPSSTMPGGKPWPRITIVTPSYNQGRYIEETLLSVFRQNYPNLEYIVIDGGSTDDTLDVVKRYDHMLSYFVSEKDRGQSHAINKGFARATGEIMGWLNSDDQLEPGALVAVATEFERSGADMVAGICSLYEDSKLTGQHLTSCSNGVLPLEDLLDLEDCWLLGKFFYQPEVFFTRNIFRRAGGTVNENLYFSMDYELWLRFAAEKARIKVIGRSLARYRQHADQKTHGEKYRPELKRVRDDFAERQKITPRTSSDRVSRKRTGMKLLFLNDVGYHYGAGIAHRRLAKTLSWGGHQLKVMALNPQARQDLGEVSRQRVHRVEQEIRRWKPDALVVGNLHGAGHVLRELRHILDAHPTVLYMHDLYMLTGGCAYPGDCKQYLTGCDDSCATAAEYPPITSQFIARDWQEKREFLESHDRLMLLADSHWVADKAKEALRTSTKIETCHYGIDAETFRPLDRSTCRSLLAIPQDMFVILIGAPSLGDRRKGFEYLTKALSYFKPEDVAVCCVGHKDPQAPDYGFYYYGYVTDELVLAEIYSAADVFVGPSIEEAFGQVFLEASACGCPSVAFNVGGVPEIVRHGISGVLAKAVCAEALAEAIKTLYKDRSLRNSLSASARLMVENEFSLQMWCHRFNKLVAESGLFETRDLLPKLTFPPHRPVAPTVESAKIKRSRKRRLVRMFKRG